MDRRIRLRRAGSRSTRYTNHRTWMQASRTGPSRVLSLSPWLVSTGTHLALTSGRDKIGGCINGEVLDRPCIRLCHQLAQQGIRQGMRRTMRPKGGDKGWSR